MQKHEAIPCERCETRIECKANTITKCECSIVQLNLNETQYISEIFEGCLCTVCLLELKKEYLDSIASADVNAEFLN